MSRHTHSTSKHPRPLIATLDGATESLFKYLDKTILGSFTTLETLLRDCEYNSQNKLIAECRFAYLKWVAESNLTDTSKRADSRLIGTAASHTLERLVTLLTDLDSTLYSAAYIMRKRQVNGRMVDWFVRDVQIALGRVEDFMDEWWGDEEGSGPGPEDMRTPMPGDFFNAERFETEIKEDVEGRKHAERLEVEARELAEEAEARVRKRAERVDGRGGGSGRYAQGYPDRCAYYQHEHQPAGGCQGARHGPGCQHAHQHAHHHGHPQAHQHGHHHGHAYGPQAGRHWH